jgi:hypothetical protein
MRILTFEKICRNIWLSRVDSEKTLTHWDNLRRTKMRKLLAGLAVLAVLGICSPSYGYILTYSGSISVKGVDVNDNNSTTTIPLKAFLVLDVNEANENFIVADANLLLYGKDPNKNKVYVLISTIDDRDLLSVNVVEDGEVFVVDLTSNNCVFNFELLMMGPEKSSKFNLVGADNNDVARALKGVFLESNLMLLSNEQNLTATGIVSMTLDPKHTASAKLEEGATLGDVTNDLIEDFLGKFTKVNLPECDGD